jgi:hypothetical protein
VTAPPAGPGRVRRDRVLTALAAAVTVAGIVLAAVAPEWLTGPLQDLVTGAGVLGPVLFVLLCVLAAPAHLLGVLVALSLLVWPLPVAVALSYAGGLLGCVVTAALLARAGAGSVRAGGPAWLRTLADRVARRPLLVGTSVRLVLHTGLAVEAFYLLTGYTRRQYLLVTAVGIALWIAQTVVGVTALAALVEVSPWLGLVLVVVPVGLVAAVAARRRTATRA